METESRARLRGLIRNGLLLRLAVACGVHFLLGPAGLAPDQSTYDFVGNGIASYWRGDQFQLPFLARRTGDATGYYYVVAVVYYLFGSWPLLPKLLNCVVGALTIPLVYRIGLSVAGDEATALRAARYTAYFPSLVLWSALNLRDIWSAYFILLACHLSFVVQDAPSLGRLLTLAGSVYMLTQFRGYIFLPIAVPIVLSFAVRSRQRLGRNLLIGGLVGLALIYVDAASGVQRRLRLPDLETFQEYRFFTSLGAQQYEATADISTPLKAAMYLPKGVTFFLLAPFPWEVRNLVQATTVPEMLFFYSLLPAMFLGIRSLLRDRLRDSLMLMLMTGALTFGYALAQSNVGTAYRHRAQVLPFFLVLAATGVEYKRRRRASSRLVAPLPRTPSPLHV